MKYVSMCCESKPNKNIVNNISPTAPDKHLILTQENTLFGICNGCKKQSTFWPYNWKETNPEYWWLK